jgi:lantibiotic modifying enzyme
MGDARMSSLADRCAEYVIRTQRPAGHWVWPSHTAGSRDVYTGFAHGVAGVTYFAAEYARRTGAPEAERAWRRGVNWLSARAERLGAALTWPNSTGRPDHWTWWCHGPVGIAVLFLRLFEQTGEARFADVARRALNVHPPGFLAVNLSQCHGASGVGDIYLEAHRVLGDRRWRQRADGVADVLWALRRSSKSGGAAWLVESPYAPTADLMVGCGGVVHFLLRASTPGSTMGLPLLLDPLPARADRTRSRAR